MKKIFFIYSLLATICAAAQSSEIDSLQKVLANDKTDTGKIIALYNLSAAYLNYNPDTALHIAVEALSRSKQVNFKKGESWSYYEMATAFYKMGNYAKALEYYIEQLKMEELNNIPYNVAEIYMQIAAVYKHQNEFGKAISYANSADSIIKANIAKDDEFEYLQTYSYMNLGDLYEKNNMLDLALKITGDGYALGAKRKDTFIMGATLTNLGNIYTKKDSASLAFKSYLSALPLLAKAQKDQWISEAALGIAKLYGQKGNTDSAAYFARWAFYLSKADGFADKELDASTFLANHFRDAHQPDSSLKYMTVMVALKDTLNSEERIKELEIISANEQLRQNELREIKLQESKERSQRLQLFAIGILVPTLFLITLVLSRAKIHSRIIRYSGVISLLFLFEYLTLLIHPYIRSKTADSPIIEIFILVAVAAILIPTHHNIEHWLLKKLQEMNNLIHHNTLAVENNAGAELDEGNTNL